MAALVPLSPVHLLLASTLVVLLALLTRRMRTPRGRREDAADPVDTVQDWPPRATRVLSDLERKAHVLLRHALPSQMILAHVPLQRFIKVPTRNSYAEWLRRVGQLNADFLVCDEHSQVLMVIEVASDDEAPGSRVQRRRERMLRVLKAAEVPVQVWHSGMFPSVSTIRDTILPAPEVPVLVDAPAPVVREPADVTAVPPLREPPPSTWFDDFDSSPVPLMIGGEKVSAPVRATP